VGVSRIDGVIILMGATTSNFITMVIPALLYLRSDNRTFYRRAGAITLIGFGIVFMFTTLLAEVFAAYDQI
jgi:amino acid permease